MYYVFETEQEAKDYDKQVTAIEKYPIVGDNWGNPIKHPTLKKWAIAVNDKVSIEGKQPETLTQDWFDV